MTLLQQQVCLGQCCSIVVSKRASCALHWTGSCSIAKLQQLLVTKALLPSCASCCLRLQLLKNSPYKQVLLDSSQDCGVSCTLSVHCVKAQAASHTVCDSSMCTLLATRVLHQERKSILVNNPQQLYLPQHIMSSCHFPHAAVVQLRPAELQLEAVTKHVQGLTLTVLLGEAQGLLICRGSKSGRAIP